MTAEAVNDGSEKHPKVTVPPSKEEVSVSSVTKAAGGEICIMHHLI